MYDKGFERWRTCVYSRVFGLNRDNYPDGYFCVLENPIKEDSLSILFPIKINKLASGGSPSDKDIIKQLRRACGRCKNYKKRRQ